MLTELTPEQEKQVQERLQGQEKEISERASDIFCTEISWLLRIMKEHFGEEAYQVLVKEKDKRTRQQWSKTAEETGDNSIEALIKHLFESWRGGEYTMEKTDSGFQMRCTKCPGYEKAKRLGITEQMFYWMCSGDPFIAEGFNPNIGFKRTKTLMQGDDCCDHFYYYKDKSK